ncbi:glycoside hydrolase domain-containing protein [Streptomyces winkii]|uniref:glycoside hydrolase domain-containing protein n=1 Tax=Streptomyces winkii TaxID=3051178 RepID=UPI0028D85B13|nr:glycoside hydrolase domain-containing protein [Streptomyces sp. DSM 40971]
MWHKNHIIRRAAVSIASLTVLTAPTVADADPAEAAGSAPHSAAPAAARASSSDPGLMRGDPRLAGAEIFQGQAFDTCHTPSAAAMRAWDGTSPFGAVGVYIGGRARACPEQPYLDRSWVRSVDRMGWRLLPVYVGSQSPCVESPRKHRFAMSHRAPAERGLREGRDAVAAAKRLGMAKHSAVYLDMESYDNSSARCATTTLHFIQAWNRAVRSAGYYPGFYSSSDSGIEHMEGARKAGRKDLPEALWFARWRTAPSLNNDRFVARKAWQPHRRIHQYDGNVTRTYGGHTISIDRNLVDAPVAVVP